MNDSHLIITLDVCQFAVSLYCANMLLLRQRNQRVYVPLALFFVANALLFLPTFIGHLWPEPEAMRITWPLAISMTPLIFLQPFFFWLFVRGLSAEDGVPLIKNKLLHAIPHVMVAMLVLIFVLFSPAFYVAELSTISQLPIWVLYLAPFGVVMTLLYYAVVGAYVVSVILLLRRYKARVKDLFATTEGRELTWVSWIAFLAALSIVWSFLDLPDSLFGVDMGGSGYEVARFFESMFDLSIIWVIGIWGSRQKPGLSRGEQPKQPITTPKNAEAASKYERSALGTEQAKRIATKIEAAMQKDKLYRDPNLSLWDLAQHVSVNSNHVSQTLNATLEKSFFDYVNSWRIKDAAILLRSTSKSILEVTYEVGFNSRSSFYTAFKRELGTTPKAFKTTQSGTKSGAATAA